jgi:protein-S-isoprenylcysteine O-methyltransferase Ste14
MGSVRVNCQGIELESANRLMFKMSCQLIMFIIFQVSVLLLFAGKLFWAEAWAYMCVYFAMILLNIFFIMPKSPGLVAERAGPKPNAKEWDKNMTGLISLAGLIMLIVAGIDERHGLSPSMDPHVTMVAIILVIAGFGMFSWALKSNEYFSSLVRIQDDRGHKVVTGGPYKLIRHPGYFGVILYSLATPFLLGSLWALIPGTVLAFLLIVRAALEDLTLHEELDGYRDYAMQVKYRIAPGIW